MIPNKQKLLVLSNIVVLIVLVAIQVSWILRVAEFENQNFNHKVEIALIDVRNDIKKSVKSCQFMCNFLNGRECPKKIRKLKTVEIDNLLKRNFEIHNIDLNYSFGLLNKNKKKDDTIFVCNKAYSHIQSLNGLLEKDGLQIAVDFPGRNRFILSQIGRLFISSILIIIFVMTSLILILRYYSKDKELIVHTREFINNMIHEFQTPLANIGFANNLIHKNKVVIDNKKLQNYSSIITEEKNKLKTHVETILNVACSEKNGLNEEKFVDINQILLMAIDNFVKLINEKNGSIKHNLNAINHIILGNSVDIYNSITNIIDNAQKYSKEKLDINITTVNKNNNIIISIFDKGIGIHKKNINQIFEKYYRVPSGDIHDTKGFGMGLTYVKNIITNHKGTISVKSNIGKGSCFIIKLPLVDKS